LCNEGLTYFNSGPYDDVDREELGIFSGRVVENKFIQQAGPVFDACTLLQISIVFAAFSYSKIVFIT